MPEARLEDGAIVAKRELVNLQGVKVTVPDDGKLVHLQFRRFAGCPVCHLHLQSFVRRVDDLKAANVREVVVFHSSAEELYAHASRLPFDVIADPRKRLYAEFGVGASPRALLDPRAYWPILRAIAFFVVAMLRKRASAPSPNPEGGRYGLPADFLVGRDGRVVASKYGAYVDDQWSVDEVLTHARAAHESRAEPVERLQHQA
ncbi:hypothetical protein AKJ09_10154 [Labilithrix luteola]|uniref:Uncharacterized protein n=1 Tax=Labilithrix luteola TaxID=1391654 RepID=A0A0K1QCI2_9BACT|nr:peroxiredoxin-like family protein [Labilithrix luteola]AKV03491.1 hypothetical protein AKJ09_10154 [Labilithrix luteola]